MKNLLSRTMGLSVLVVILLNSVLNLRAQPVDSISMMLASPFSNQQVLQQAMEDYITSGVAIDSHLLKMYDRNNSFYGAYIGNDGTENNFYPSYLPSTNGNSQILTDINDCIGLPTEGWKTLGPKFINHQDGYNGRLTSVAIAIGVGVNDDDIVYAGSENGGLWRKVIGTNNWENITDNFGFPALGIQDIAINPSNPLDIYCATGIHKYQGMFGYGIGIIHSTDGGNTWVRENVSSNNTYNKEAVSVKFAPTYPHVVFAGGGNDLYQKSGNTWVSVFTTYLGTSSTYRQIIRDIKFVVPVAGGNQQRKLIISTHVVSNDNIPSGYENAQVAICNLDGNNQVTGSWSNINNNNGGLIKPVAGVTRRISVDVSKSNAQKIYASYDVSHGAGIAVVVVESSDLGVTWNSSPIYYKYTAGYYEKVDINRNDIRISPSNDNLYYNAAAHLRKSVNNQVNGDDWVDINDFHMDVRGIEIVTRDNQEEIWVAHDGGLHRSTDQGSTWTLEHKNMVIGEYYDVGVCEKDDRVIAGALDNNTHVYYNGIWKRGIDAGDGSPSLIFKSNEDKALGSINGSVQLYTFSTNNFTHVHSNDGIGFGNNAPIVQNPIFDNRALIGQNQLYEYILNGTKTQLGTLPNGAINGIAMSHQTENKIYISKPSAWAETNNYLWKTTDKGLNWTDLSTSVRVDLNNVEENPFFWGVTPTDIVINADNDEDIYMSLSGVKDDWFKVIYSNNGGELNPDGTSSWVDFSGSLPNIVVHELEILDSYPNDVLLAGTDLGVYYRVLDGVSDWECFNKDLPPSIIKNFEIRYCTKELYVATHGHGIYKADISELLGYKDETIPTGTSVTWTTDQTFYNDIIISEGATLTINGATISMGSDAKIIVKQGAKLNVFNSTITSYCNAFWNGIEVWGKSDLATNSQYITTPLANKAGKLLMISSTLENAENAVRLWNPDNWNTIGGILYASHSNFLNNRRDVEFMAYENHHISGPNSGSIAPYLSSFNDCSFEVDENYLFDVKPPQQARVSMWRVRGIHFNGCEFKNTTGETQNLVGIGSIDADYSVNNYSSSPSVFSGLKAGVDATGSGANYTFTVDNASFTDNEFGVIAAGVDAAVITRNTFTPYAPNATTNDVLYPNGTAIYLDVCDQYMVQENNMTGYQPDQGSGQPALSNNGTGIVIMNSGTSPNEVYKNTYTDLNRANVAYGLNFNFNEEFRGLEYQCNTVSNSALRDISIYGSHPFGVGIATSQGGSNDAADNTFTTAIPVNTGHIYNNTTQTQTLNYHHHANVPSYNFEPSANSNTVITTEIPGAYDENVDCPSMLPSGIQDLPGKLQGLDIGGKWLKTSEGKNGYDQAKYLYTSLIDGGDTYGLLNTVQNNNAQTAWDLRTDLINSSPLSIEVINETIDEEFLSNALLHDVLMVNPHGVRDEGIMYKLENKTTPMPAYMINTLLGIYEAQTQKDVLEGEMATELQKAHQAAQSLLWHWRSDTITPINDSILALMDTLNTPEAEWNKVAYQISKGNTSAAQTLITNMPTKFTLTDYENDMYNDLEGYYTQYLTMLGTGQSSFSKPTPAQLTSMQSLAADTNTKGGRMAQNLVLFAEGKLYWPTLPAEPQNKKEEADPRAMRSEEVTNLANVYPNPVNGYVTIEFTQLEEKQSMYVSVVNNVGVQVLSHRETMNPGGLINLVTTGLASGQYFVLIYSQDKLIQKQAIEVIH